MKAVGVFVVVVAAIPAIAGVSVSAPVNNSNVATSVQYVATATTSCGKGVSAMGIYTAPNVLAYTLNGSTLNTQLSFNPRTYNTVGQERDNCGGRSAITITNDVRGSAAQVPLMASSNN